ncbi:MULTISPECIES: hypothetical protein [Alphaproteobacteria]|uniref:hypothetical protein n=1 Tax=Alphaproteobacteria TaxID=28211 RepID=UPI0015582FBF|nr:MULTISPECIES: hypothetical protein [Alphaproteobacteria]
MKLVREILAELYGLFVDDGWLALQVLAVVFLCALAVGRFGVSPFAAGGFLIVGCMVILMLSLRRSR